MTWLSGIVVALRALCLHKVRSGLSMLGVMIGVAAVITTAAIGRGAQSEISAQLEALGSNYIAIFPGSYTAAGVRLGSGTRASLTQGDAFAIATELDDVDVAAPIMWSGGQIVASSANWSTGYLGVTPEYLKVRAWPIAHGRGFDADDIVSAAKVVLLGETVARSLFGDADPVDQIVRVGKVPMVVIGVLAQKGQNAQGRDQDDYVLMPITTLRSRLLGGTHAKLRLVHSIAVKVYPDAAAAEVHDAIRTLLRQRHRLQSSQPDDFTIRDLTEAVTARDEAARTMALLIAAVGAVSLLVGGIGIMNTMLASVSERTREIGLRMAVGARTRDILYQFVIEALMIAMIGGACGIVLGVGTSLAIADLAGWRMQVDLAAISLATAFAAAVGLSFGFYPARKASQLPPLVALRFE